MSKNTDRSEYYFMRILWTTQTEYGTVTKKSESLPENLEEKETLLVRQEVGLVNDESIDASIGLMLSLPLFERYRKSGVLQATLRRLPGVRGPAIVQVRLVEGKVVACEIDDSLGQHHTTTLAFLVRHDQEKGPFDWKLIPYSTPSSQAQGKPSLRTSPPLPTEENSGIQTGSQPRIAAGERDVHIPRIIAQLQIEQVSSWESHYQLVLYTVYSWIDGRHSIEEIKSNIALPPQVVDEACRILLLLKVIE
jgi:hypothetical protein